MLSRVGGFDDADDVVVFDEACFCEGSCESGVYCAGVDVAYTY